MGLAIKWDITYKCNLFCSHCINGHLLSNKNPELSTKEIYNIVDNISNQIDIDYIHLLGGEPTFRKDFLEITKYFEQKSIEFGFNTNGLNLRLSKIGDVISNKYLKDVVVSLEGPNAQINDKIRGKNVFDVVVKNLKEVIKYKNENDLKHFCICVNTVVSRENYDYILDMIDFCIDLGIEELNFLQFIPEGNAGNKLSLALSVDEEISLVESIAKKFKDIKDKIRLNPKFTRPIAKDYCEKCLKLQFPDIIHGCGAGSSFAFIDNLGYIYPCDRYYHSCLQDVDKEMFNLNKKEFFEVWGNSIFDEPFRLTQGEEVYKKYYPCNKCSHLRKECYPCFIYGKNEESLNIINCARYFDLLNKKGVI